MLSGSPGPAWPTPGTPGTPDGLFNQTGAAYADPTAGHDVTQAVSVDLLGRTLVAANGPAGVSVTRFTLNGAPDARFGAGGTAAADYFHGGLVTSVVALPDGKVVLAGVDPSAADAGGNPLGEFAMVRLNADGSQDLRFGRGGEAVTHFAAGSSDFASRVALDAHFRLVVGGSSTSADGARSFAAARYNYDGTPDTRFGADHTGRVTVAAGGPVNLVNVAGMAVDGDGVVLGGNAVDSGAGHLVFALTRLDSDGRVSRDFAAGTGGVATFDAGGSGFMSDLVAVGGRIVAAGGVEGATTGTDFLLVGFDSRGRLDRSFGAGGVTVTDLGGDGGDEVLDLAVQGDKIVAVGNSGTNVAVARYTARGAIDKSFGAAGVVLTTSAATQIDPSHPAAICATAWWDRIVVAATHTGSSADNGQIEVLRFNA